MPLLVKGAGSGLIIHDFKQLFFKLYFDTAWNKTNICVDGYFVTISLWQ
jgi:hypothetical protein